MLINDIQQLDLQTKSYAVDLYVWFKWDDPKIDPSRSFEFLNPFQLWGHIRGYAGIKPETLPDGTQYSSLHVQGQFNSNLAIDDYPFDRQELIVMIEDKSKDESALVYEPDTSRLPSPRTSRFRAGTSATRPWRSSRTSTRPTSAMRAPPPTLTRG
jgi:hypothetical protein